MRGLVLDAKWDPRPGYVVSEWEKETGKAIFTSSKVSPQDIEAKLIESLQSSADEINEKCPMMLDKETRLDKVTVGPGLRMVYHETIVKYKSNDIDANWFSTNIRKELVRQVCSKENMSKTLQYGGIYVYSYYWNDAVEIASFEIKRGDCGLPAITP